MEAIDWKSRAENAEAALAEARAYILEASNDQVGSGDEPVRFLIASHRLLVSRLAEARDALRELVTLKDMAIRNGDWENCGGEMIELDEYQRRKPLAWAAARAALYGIPSTTESDRCAEARKEEREPGMVRVPREPTDAMVYAARKCGLWSNEHTRKKTEIAELNKIARTIYRAMIAAALPDAKEGSQK